MSLAQADLLSDSGRGGRMVGLARTFSASYPAVAASVPMARRALGSLAVRAGATEDQAETVRLAASEAVTSVVLHAYPHRRGEVHVSAWATSEDLWLLIGDDGVWLLAEDESDGLGLALIAGVSDDFLIAERASGGTELQIRFRLAQPSRPMCRSSH